MNRRAFFKAVAAAAVALVAKPLIPAVPIIEHAVGGGYLVPLEFSRRIIEQYDADRPAKYLDHIAFDKAMRDWFGV